MPLYFAYGTLQRGLPNHDAYAADLGECIGRVRTVERFPLVVPREPACANPGCRFVHRMGVLVHRPGAGEHVEGELYAPHSLARLDELEDAPRTYARRAIVVEPADGGEPVEAEAYFVTDDERWLSLLERGEADTVARYTLELATGPLKPCCRVDPGHAGPHDVV
jgi:gamma-glutamylcyclotransferase (GGCT)/AIG2-like uncharacterized protein YtfP